MTADYTIKQLAKLAGVSVRTLHYYDEIDLLKPAKIGTNSYRYYDDASLLRLQQILLYRELEVDLAQIKAILDDPVFDLVAALQTHRSALATKVDRLHTLIDTIDNTIKHVNGEHDMSNKQIFQGFDEAKQKQYEVEAAEAWGDTVTESVQNWNSYDDAKQQAILAEGDAIYAEIAANIAAGPESKAVQSLLVRWHQHIRYFYEPTFEVLAGLGAMYHDDDRFNATFTEIDTALPVFLKAAIAIYVDNLETQWLEAEVKD